MQAAAQAIPLVVSSAVKSAAQFALGSAAGIFKLTTGIFSAKFFAGILLGYGLSALGAALFPAKSPKQKNSFKTDTADSVELQSVDTGGAIAIVYGQRKIAGNILYIGPIHPFTVAHAVTSTTQASGGKGGGGSKSKSKTTVSYWYETRYRRSFLIGICEGPATVREIWKDKEKISRSDATCFMGLNNQNISAVTGLEFAQHRRLCCAWFSEYDLGNQTSVPNFSFVVRSRPPLPPTPGKIHISTVEQLQTMRDNPTADFELMNDIDASDTRNWNGGLGFIPIGSSLPGPNVFSGTFDGRGYSICDLYISRLPTQIEDHGGGFFSIVQWPAIIKNVDLLDVEIHCQSITGALCGSSSGATIFACQVSGSIHGYNGDYIHISLWECGGLIGVLSGDDAGHVGSVQQCLSEVDVITYYRATHVGGFVGRIATGTIADCYSTGNIVIGCTYNPKTGKYSGYGFPYFDGVGGFVGYCDNFGDKISVSRCYSIGHVPNQFSGDFGLQYLGGFDQGRIGGFVGNGVSTYFYKWPKFPDSYRMFYYCYYDTQTSGLKWPSGRQDISVPDGFILGVEGKTTAQMKKRKTFVTWDFFQVWGIYENFSYPWLRVLAPDITPPQMIRDLLINVYHGVGLPESFLDDALFLELHEYCLTMHYKYSIIIDEQSPIVDWIDSINEHWFGYLFFSQGKIKIGAYRAQPTIFDIERDNMLIEVG